jgi:GT2 family glycosyltransferase
LHAIGKQSYRDFECILVDNGSTDNSLTIISDQFDWVKLIALKNNTGFAAAINFGIQSSDAPYIVLLNNDTEVNESWLSELITAIEGQEDEVAAIQSLMLQMDDPELIDDAGDRLSWYGLASKGRRSEKVVEIKLSKEIFSPSGGATLYRRSFLEQMSGMDPDYFAYLEDVDLGLRGKLYGYRFLLEPKARVLHKSHGSSIPRSSYVRLLTRNRLLLFFKNLPTRVLMRNVFRLLYGQLYHFIAYAQPIASIRGYCDFLKLLRKVKRDRKDRLANVQLSNAQIQSCLHSETPSPPLSHFIKGYLFSLLKIIGLRRKTNLL